MAQHPSSGPSTKASPPGVGSSQPPLHGFGPEFRQGRLFLLPLPKAIEVLHELHLRAIGSQNKPQIEYITRMTQREAKIAYHQALPAFLASFSISPLSIQEKYLADICAFCRARKSFGGLKSAFLTILATISSSKQRSEVSTAIGVWKSVGPPQYIGGGFRFRFFFNTQTNIITYFGRPFLESLGRGGANSGLLDGERNMFTGIITKMEAGSNKLEQGGSGPAFLNFGCALMGAALGTAAAGAAIWASGGLSTLPHRVK